MSSPASRLATERTRLYQARAAAKSWLSPHFVVMSLVFLGAALVGYLLLPDDNERIAMLERDGHDRQALTILQQRFANGDRRQRTLFQLQRLYEQKGDLPRARSMLELLAEARPRDANVQRHLAQFYRATQDEAGYLRVLEGRLSQRYSEPLCKELIGRYRRAGRYEDEQRTLSRCRRRGYRRTNDLIRMAHLYAADGKLEQAAGLLRSIDDRRRLISDHDRHMLFAALLEAGQAPEAKRRAARWFKGSRDDGLILQIIDLLASQDRYELAVDLAREVGQPGDSISLAVAELMLDREQTLAARSYLRGWLDVTQLRDLELAQRVVRAAIDAEDPLLAYQAGQKYGLARMPADDLIALAEALSAVDQREPFQEVRKLINPELIRENLLLAAAVEVEQGKPEPARQLLSRVQVKALDEWRLALWARLMTSTGRRATAQQTLRHIAAEVEASKAANGRPPIATLATPATEPNPAPTALVRPGSAEGGRALTPPLPTKPTIKRPTRRTRIIRQRNSTGTRKPPRRSRLNKPAAAPKATLPKLSPFPFGG